MASGTPLPPGQQNATFVLTWMGICAAVGGALGFTTVGGLGGLLVGVIGGACVGSLLSMAFGGGNPPGPLTSSGSEATLAASTPSAAQTAKEPTGGTALFAFDVILRLLLLAVLLWSLVWLYRFEADRARALDALKQLQSPHQPGDKDGPRRPFAP